MKKFEVNGKIKNGKMEKNFKKEVFSLNQNTAMEKVMNLFGSKNKVKRRHIEINEVKEVK